MDDLSGLDWNAQSKSDAKPQTSSARPTYSYPTLQPTPSPSNSGRSTPLAFSNVQSTSSSAKTLRPVSKPSTPANDSFASLLKPGANRTQNTLSLQERQKQLQDEKARQEAEANKKLESQYGNQHGTFWDGLGAQSRTISPLAGNSSQGNSGLSDTINRPFSSLNGSSQSTAGPPEEEEKDDILAAFNSSALVDSSSHFPPPRSTESGKSNPGRFNGVRSPPVISASSNFGYDFNDDDDPFGLSQVKQQKHIPVAAATTIEDDDILGMLGKPVSDLPKPAPPSRERKPRARSPSPPEGDFPPPDHPQAKAVSELVDMGFPADKAADALAETDTGMNVQAAVSILLKRAHEQAQQKSRGRQPTSDRQDSVAGVPSERRPQREGKSDPSIPAWMREEDEKARSGSRPKDGQTSAEKDFAQQAQNIGASLFKSANSLWKTGQKKVQQAVSEFQQEGGDSSQPKWMREAQTQESDRASGKGKAPIPSITDEAAMLEGGAPKQRPARPPPITRTSTQNTTNMEQWNDIPDDMFQPRRSPRPGANAQRQAPVSRSARQLTRQEVEEQAEEVFVSSRRRRPAPQPASATTSNPSTRDASPMPSLTLASRNPFGSKPSTPAALSKPSTPIPPRPKAPIRNVPSVSSIALQNSLKQRTNGSEAFKRGDYSSAHTHYTSALQGIPTSHPIAIVIFCNRALTNIKVGDPKAAISDADLALATIGISRGEGEKIALGGSEGEKDMKELYGKALTRKAEAFENMEKWSDAAKVWREAVEAGVGGSVSMQGRNRCEKAAGGGSQNPSARSTPAPRPVPRKTPPKPSALSDLQGRPAISSQASTEAVKKLREANAAAEKADDEKFALTDIVDAKLVMWKGSKSDNLRALLGSLDKVLWSEAGWSKVGMQDLVMPNRVKIVYMKAIAKVHPDKIPQTATTEQKMISASVFATLNEAWDKFKTDNGM